MEGLHERAFKFNTVESAYIPLHKWQSYEKQYYDMPAIYEFHKYISRFGQFDIYFDRRRNMATVDELRNKGQGGKMTYIVLRNPWTRKPEILPKEHKREFLKVYTKFKDVESQVDSKKLDEAFEY